MADSGLLVRSHEVSAAEWSDKLRIERLDMLHSIRQMIERNLERLSPEEQVVLEGAAVAGAEFCTTAVAAALQRSQHEVEACCAQLARREQFIQAQGASQWPDGNISERYAFLHVLYAEVLYGRIPYGERAELHHRIAECEEAAYGDRSSEIAAELANHYSRANDKDKAVKYFHLAAERAVARSAMIEAQDHYNYALELLGALPQSRARDSRELQLRLGQGAVLSALEGDASQRLKLTYGLAQDLCKQLGDPPKELFSASFGLWVVHSNRGELRESYDLAENLALWAQGLPDKKLLQLVEHLQGLSCYWMGGLLQAKDHLDAAAAIPNVERSSPTILRQLGYDFEVLRLVYLALTTWHLGYPNQALSQVRKALARAQAQSNRPDMYLALSFLGVVHQFRGETEEVEEAGERLAALWANYGLADWQGWPASLRGWVMAVRGHYQEGIAGQLDGLAKYTANGARLWRPYFLCLLSESYINQNLLDDGLKVLIETQSAVEAQEIRFWEAEVHRLKGELLLKQDERHIAQAQFCFERAIQIAQEQQAKALELRATSSLARLLIRQKDRSTARARLAKIYDWFTEGFDTFDLQEARALHSELNEKQHHEHR